MDTPKSTHSCIYISSQDVQLSGVSGFQFDFFFFFYSPNPPVCLTVLLSTFSVVWKRCALSFNLTICAARSMPAPHVFCQFLFCKNKQRDSLWTVTPVDPSPPVFKKTTKKKIEKKEELSDLEWGTEQYWSNTGTRHTVLRKTVL